MKNGKLGFIGIGNMASAIIGGILSSGTFPVGDIYMYNPHAEKMQRFTESGCVACTSAEEVAELCDTVFLCVKPQIFPEVLRVIAPTVAKKNADDVVIVSIAAGVTFKNLQDALGEGATVLCQTSNVPEEDFARVRSAFSCCGVTQEIDEAQMNAVIAVSGSSPAYLYLLAKLTCDYAAQQGIDPKTALTLFCQTMKGSADMLLNSGKDPQALMDMVTSKGGTTFALLNVLKEQGFNEAMISSFETCTHRAEELSM